ncbi:hypothetical protein AB0I28_13110 [Phytomonospora sp. NPDC050363]|uniref:hypothetical protein n=1 Tax=Phytomonospora sp. NPDC050363 TaxID=3155642 RepID=UPI0033FF217B
MDAQLAAAEHFIDAHARPLERHLFAARFHNGPATAVVDALRVYRNPDGGFGHGLEPDTRCPDSLPIYAEVALGALADAGADAPELVEGACDYLAGVSDGNGAVPLAFPVIEAHPRAEHWSEWTYRPDVNPTAGLVSLLYRLGAEHPWRETAAGYCWRYLESEPTPDGVHSLWELLHFLEHVPDRERAERHAPALLAHLVAQDMFHADADAPGYGLTPLHIAPTPESPWRTAFTEAQIDAHLDHLSDGQEPDGGWPITWTPPGEEALAEWRGVVTLEAVRTLAAYGRLG